jgi:hypothetical protein
MSGFMLGTVIQYTSWDMNYTFPFLKIVKNVKLTEKSLIKHVPRPSLPMCFFFSLQ